LKIVGNFLWQKEKFEVVGTVAAGLMTAKALCRGYIKGSKKRNALGSPVGK
jgi:hypothetical protein